MTELAKYADDLALALCPPHHREGWAAMVTDGQGRTRSQSSERRPCTLHSAEARGLLASPVLARMVTDAEHRGKQAAREEDWSSEHDGRRWAISSQRTLLTEVVDAILVDVFQGERDQARGHMLDVAAKVGRKRAGWWIDGALADAWDEGFQRAADETLSPFVPEGPTDQQNPYRTDER